MTHSSLFYPDHPATYITAHLSFASTGINFDSHKALIKHRASSKQAKQRLIYDNVPLCLVLLCPRGRLSALGSPGCLQCHGCLGCLEHLEALARLVHPDVTRGWKTRTIKWERMTQTQVEDKHKVSLFFFPPRYSIIPPIDRAI